MVSILTVKLVTMPCNLYSNASNPSLYSYSQASNPALVILLCILTVRLVILVSILTVKLVTMPCNLYSQASNLAQ